MSGIHETILRKILTGEEMYVRLEPTYLVLDGSAYGLTADELATVERIIAEREDSQP